MSDATPITHNESTRRFELQADGHTAYLEYAPVAGGLAFTHTIVPKALEGRGIGSRLVKHALDWADAQSHKVQPACSFVETWVARHPEYQHLVLA